MAPKPATLDEPPSRRLADFDEQLWPVNLLLLLLAAGVAGLIVARADFETRDPWTNGYVHLAILGAVVLLLGLAAAVLNRAHQRRMQLAVLASLLLHLWLSVGMQEYRLPQVASPHPQALARDRLLVRVPDYNAHQLEHPAEKQFFEQPVDAEPATPLDAVSPKRKQPAPEVLAKNKPRPRELPKPQPVEIERAAPSAPHRGERLTTPKKTARDQLANLGPAAAAQQRLAAAEKQPPPAEMPNPALEHHRAAAELEPRLAMSGLPRAGRASELQAAPAPAAVDRHDTSAAGNPNAPPAIDRIARSTTGSALPEQAVPVAPSAGSKPSDSPLGEINPATGRAARTSQPAAASLSPPIGLPLAGPGFEGPTIPIGPHFVEGAPGTGADIQQPTAPGGISRARRDDMPLAGDRAVVATAGGPAASATGQAPMPGEAEPAMIPRSRGGQAPSLGARGQAAASIGADLSLGHVPGAPAMRAFEGQPGLQPLGPAGETDLGPAVPLRKHGSDAAIDSDALASQPAALPAARGAGRAPKPAELLAGPPDPTTGRMSGPASVPLRNSAPLRSAVPLAADAGGQPTIETGLPSQRARPESNLLASDTPRMILERSGGERAMDSRVRDTAVPGYKQRDRAGRSNVARQRGGSVETEQAVENGLAFLARFQADNGSWNLHNTAPGFDYRVEEIPQLNSTTAATGLSLLAFLGAGYTHTDGPHRALVQRGLNYLLAHQRPGGDLFEPQDAISNSSAWLYSHGIASIALCEAYGMTRDRRLREPAQRALDFIAAAQSPDEGGWRYAPRRGSDTSVSGWQLMALKSGELAGLKVPRDCYARVAGWLDSAAGAQGHDSRYAYLPGSDNASYRSASTVMTAEALLMRQYLGWRHDHPEMIAGADWLTQNLPQFGTATNAQPTGSRNAYYWYYGTQVMFQMQGRYWNQWNSRLRPLLIESQTTDGPLAGSWDPVQPVPDRYGYMVGRLYVTALHLLILEVYYRHLPIYQTLEDAPAR